MNNKFTGYTDEQLINSILSDPEAEDELMIRYKNLVRQKAGSMFLIGGERDDLIQEGMIGLLKAIRSYEPDKGSGFAHYAGICISAKMYSAIESSRRLKHVPLNSYISFYSENNEYEGSHNVLADVLVVEGSQNPENLIIDQENIKILDDILERELSEMESEVLNLLLSGMGYVEIAGILNKSPKQIDNAIQRIRSKLHRALGR